MILIVITAIGLCLAEFGIVDSAYIRWVPAESSYVRVASADSGRILADSGRILVVRQISDEKAVKKHSQRFIQLGHAFGFDWRIIAAIALRESRCNPNVKPLREKTWTYYTDKNGKALKLRGKGYRDIQAQAEKLLGKDEFEFQTHAHGITQLVGSVLRELGYKRKTPPAGVGEQLYFTGLHLSKLVKFFTDKYHRPPNAVQVFALYNGGYSAATEFGVQPWVEKYAVNAMLFYFKVQLMTSIVTPTQ